MLARFAARSIVLFGGIALAMFAVPASALPIGGAGIDVGGACAAAASCAPVDYDFALAGAAPAEGTIGFTDVGGGFWEVDVDLTVDTMTLTATAGAVGGVDTIIFTSLVYSAQNWTAMDLGTIEGLGSIMGTVSGSYTEKLGAAVITGPTIFTDVGVVFDTLSCHAVDSGQCGIQVGYADTLLFPGLHLLAAGSDHEFQSTFNVTLVPEPATATLLGLGLISLAAIRRRRA